MPYRVPTILSAIAIFQYLQDKKGSRCTLSNIARDLNMNKSTCLSILRTLQEGGLLAYDELTKVYRLGPALISLGSAAARQTNHVEVALAMARKLVEQIGFVCIISVLAPNGEIVVVAKAESLKNIKITAAVGDRLPITAAALGKCFLAWMPHPEAEALIDRTRLTPFPGRAVVDEDAFWSEIQRTRVQGYSESHGEYLLHTNAVGAPVFGTDGRVMFVLCVFGLSSDLTEELVPLYGSQLVDTANAITEAIGGSFPDGFPRSKREQIQLVAQSLW